MEDYQSAEETTFVVDEVSNIVKEAIESAIGGNAYQHSKVNQWTTNVVEQTLSQLTKLGKPFKYIVTCIIMQKNGAGLHTASSCFWDSSTDHCAMGEQDHVLHRQRLRTVHLTDSSSPRASSSVSTFLSDPLTTSHEF
ncbi:dynein light chain Tctex-type 1 isoform X1 [Pipistrellus kuhlii]|uniref:dynein light chain Tctex-type 1 isoform X1 n=1 Tax=Pipistrellus kuhlii TaxID=59472 RepID=UPI00174F5350|nr:dynein light chain Tctex-type 1 isoform X1 [Pipistrellus kuhlii]